MPSINWRSTIRKFALSFRLTLERSGTMKVTHLEGTLVSETLLPVRLHGVSLKDCHLRCFCLGIFLDSLSARGRFGQSGGSRNVLVLVLPRYTY